MGRSETTNSVPVIRPLQYRDLDELRQWRPEDINAGESVSPDLVCEEIERLCRWYGPLKLASLMPRKLQNGVDSTFVAEYHGKLLGLIQVAPCNQGRSTWQVNRIVSNRATAVAVGHSSGYMDVGSRLLRYCFEKVWEARTWMIEVDINNKSALALYRFNGFQPLAQVTYWHISPEQLQPLAQQEPDLPNLLPVSNADAQLLYQLDTASMPPLVRQVFDHQILDFKGSVATSVGNTLDRWLNQTETVSAYVFEPQRKAAIGYFKLVINQSDQPESPHQADLTVHPAYTWLYPELLAQMARVLQPYPTSGLKLASLDYQPEREEFLNQIQALPQDRSLLMSRSVWHKVREAKPVSLESLQLSDVLSGLQPAGKPVPGRMSWSWDRRQDYSGADSYWGPLFWDGGNAFKRSLNPAEGQPMLPPEINDEDDDDRCDGDE
ncbi:N-acetyltransferase [filamentous cyanobacterium CCP5]|nr:N-acetyltransferase [filamentous cyanobacterium CCP5]